MSKAFLSHSSSDKETVESIANKLGRDNCIIDKYNFAPGQPTLDEIIKGIANTDLFVLFISEKSLNSEWVQKEIAFEKNFKNKDIQKQVLVFIIDSNITHSDTRIPKWLRDEYNIKEMPSLAFIYKFIDSRLRDISIEKYPHIKKKEEIFIGRNDLMNEFEKKYYNIHLIKPSVIITSGLEGSGRRKFTKNALDKVGRVSKFHDPLLIALNTRDSIEDFIFRIEDLNDNFTEDLMERVKNAEFEWKISYSKHLLKKFKETNQILFVLDNGCIIQPNKIVARWFSKLFDQEDYKNQLVVCIISTIRPLSEHLSSNTTYINFHCTDLSPIDRQILFLKYCELLEIEPDKEQIEKVLEALHGMPEQIYYASQLIKERGINHVVNNLDKIRRYDDVKVFSLISLIREENEIFYEILLFISQIEFIPFDSVYTVFGNTDLVNEALDKLYVFGIYERIGYSKEYIKVHHAITDYVSRAKFQIPVDLRKKINIYIDDMLKNDNLNVSELLLTIKNLIIEKRPIPEKYHIPSFTLRAIIEHYNNKDYKQAILLAETLLQNFRKYDDSITRDVRYHLCKSYARESKEEFFEQVKYFERTDYFFLLGFYRRIEKKYKEAENCFRKALGFDSESQKSRRELVNVLLSLNRYDDAIEFAKKNYDSKKLNAFHIQAYFACISKKKNKSKSDLMEIDELMSNITMSHDYKSKEIRDVMSGEYEFYVNNNFEKARDILTDLKSKKPDDRYPSKALMEIYYRAGFVEQAETMKKGIKGDIIIYDNE